jgi:AbrB family looped-hinge helix DNA binding protein
MNHEMIVTLSKGQQITIPAEIRNKFGLEVGSKIEIILKKDRIIMKPMEEDLETLFKEADKRTTKHNLNAEQMDKLNERIFR